MRCCVRPVSHLIRSLTPLWSRALECKSVCRVPLTEHWRSTSQEIIMNERQRLAVRVMPAPLPSTALTVVGQHDHDFSKVRIHTGVRAAEAAQSVGASAFTVGSSIVFAAGQYRPETHWGLRLLAHELTHVVQQSSNGASVQRQPSPAPAPSFATSFVPSLEIVWTNSSLRGVEKTRISRVRIYLLVSSSTS